MKGGFEPVPRYYAEVDTPSRQDGLSKEQEDAFRSEYCQLLDDSGKQLQMMSLTIKTAVVYTHQYYVHCAHGWRAGKKEETRNPMNDRQFIASAALFLAGKVEEDPKPLNDVVYVTYLVGRGKKKPRQTQERLADKQHFDRVKDKFMEAERQLLHNLGFSFNVTHPFTPVAQAGNKWRSENSHDEFKWQFEIQNQVPSTAWALTNDSYRTTLCVQYEASFIAAAMLTLAMKLKGKSASSEWWRSWLNESGFTHVPLPAVSDITSQLCALYFSHGHQSFAQLQNDLEQEIGAPAPPGSSSLQPIGETPDNRQENAEPSPKTKEEQRHAEAGEQQHKHNAVHGSHRSELPTSRSRDDNREHHRRDGPKEHSRRDERDREREKDKEREREGDRDRRDHDDRRHRHHRPPPRSQPGHRYDDSSGRSAPPLPPRERTGERHRGHADAHHGRHHHQPSSRRHDEPSRRDRDRPTKEARRSRDRSGSRRKSRSRDRNRGRSGSSRSSRSRSRSRSPSKSRHRERDDRERDRERRRP